MRKLNSANIDNKQLFLDIAKGKKKIQRESNPYCKGCRNKNCEKCANNSTKIMLGKKKLVFDRYDGYPSTTVDLDGHQSLPQGTFSDFEKELMEESYESERFKAKRTEIFDAAKIAKERLCPFCMITEATTLDHYFSQSDFPEYDIFTPNLVPACGDCNSKKSKFFRDKKGNRQFLHYYYDDIPSDKFLYCDISYQAGVPVCSFRLELDLALPVSKVIKLQFLYLNLFYRYKDKSNSYLSTTLETMKEEYDEYGNIDALLPHYVAELKVLRKKYGNNYWKTCILEGLIANKAMLDNIIKTMP